MPAAGHRRRSAAANSRPGPARRLPGDAAPREDDHAELSRAERAAQRRDVTGTALRLDGQPGLTHSSLIVLVRQLAVEIDPEIASLQPNRIEQQRFFGVAPRLAALQIPLPNMLGAGQHSVGTP